MCINVLICDRNALVRSGLKAVLYPESDIEVVSELPDWRELREVSRYSARPDVVLLGAACEQELMRALAETRPVSGTPGLVVVFSGLSTNNLALRAYLAGASGVIGEANSPSELLATIRCVAGGGAVIAPPVARLVLDLVAGMSQLYREPNSSLATLSVRERQVLVHLVSGYSNREIAHRLSIAEATVRSHVSHLLGKLNLRSRVEAAVFAHRCGLAAGPDAVV